MWPGSRRAKGSRGQGDAQSNRTQGGMTALFLCLYTRPPGTALSGRLALPYLPIAPPPCLGAAGRCNAAEHRSAAQGLITAENSAIMCMGYLAPFHGEALLSDHQQQRFYFTPTFTPTVFDSLTSEIDRCLSKLLQIGHFQLVSINLNKHVYNSNPVTSTTKSVRFIQISQIFLMHSYI